MAIQEQLKRSTLTLEGRNDATAQKYKARILIFMQSSMKIWKTYLNH